MTAAHEARREEAAPQHGRAAERGEGAVATVAAARGGVAAALGRRALWRTALRLMGGLKVEGEAPTGACVVIANHSSHADTAALLAALPARTRPGVAAAADYWFGRGARASVCRALVGAFPVRRDGGGSADLMAAADLLRAGRVVIVYPEGTRSRDGSLSRFHSGAARLAAEAGVPLVPVAIEGTRDLLPAHGRLRRARVKVRFGTPTGEITEARDQIGRLLDSPLRRRAQRLAESPAGMALVGGWAFAEALSWPLLPELPLAALCVASPRAGVRLSVSAAVGSVAGGAVTYGLAARGVRLPRPLTTPRMITTVAAQSAIEGAQAVRHQPVSGIPFKVYAAQAGRDRAGLAPFLRASARARGTRVLATGLALTALGAGSRRTRHLYGPYLVVVGAGFAAGLTLVVRSWARE